MTTVAAVSTAGVSVLNASYEPLGKTKLARAMALVLRGDAVVEESDPLRRVRHESGFHPWPKVIRLLRYVKIAMRYGPELWTKAGVLKRDNYKCAYCTKRKGDTIDHIIPQAQGGGNTWENTVACCSPCNNKKDCRTPKEASMTLLFKPYTPMKSHFNTKK